MNRKLLGQFYYEGRDYEFNFSKFWTGSRTFFDCTETDTQILWKVTQTTFRAKMEAEIACNKEEMLDTLTQATEKEMQGVKQAGMMKDLKALDEWVHHLRSSWSVIRADKPLWKLHGLLHKEGGSTEDEISRAVDAVVRMGQSIIEQAKKERRIQDEGFCG